jgi:hypothetical protein
MRFIKAIGWGLLAGLVLAAFGHVILYNDPAHGDAPFEVNTIVTILCLAIGVVGALAREAMEPARWSSDA